MILQQFAENCSRVHLFSSTSRLNLAKSPPYIAKSLSLRSRKSPRALEPNSTTFLIWYVSASLLISVNTCSLIHAKNSPVSACFLSLLYKEIQDEIKLFMNLRSSPSVREPHSYSPLFSCTRKMFQCSNHVLPAHLRLPIAQISEATGLSAAEIEAL